MRKIDADALLEILQSWRDAAEKINAPVNYKFASAIIAQVERMPTIEERKKGTWLVHLYKLGKERYECDQCQGRCDMGYRYCPNCGADMREGQE